MASRLTRESESFQGIWSGGYLEGDPLDPVAKSGYGALGYVSVLHATYLACIKPCITSETVALEIGPGRGALRTYTRRTSRFPAAGITPELNALASFCASADFGLSSGTSAHVCAIR